MGIVGATIPVSLCVKKGSDVPLFLQLVGQIADLIAAGKIKPGARLPTVRALSDHLDINQMTVARAYKELSRRGFVEARRGDGTFVRPPNGRVRDDTRPPDSEHRTRRLLSQRLYELANAPGVIAFTANYPRPGPAYAEEIRACMSEAALGDLESYFKYEPPGGRQSLREQIAAFLRHSDIHASPDDIVVTSGAQQAIDLIVRQTVPPGAPVVVERPTYYGAINAIRAAGARILEVPLEPDGMNIETLERHLARDRPRLIYLNPTFHNPTGTSTSAEKRRTILKLARNYGVLILEDDHCPELRFSGEPLAPIRALDSDGASVVYVRSFGKVFWPGSRLGFMVVPPARRRDILHAKALTDLHSNAVVQVAMDLFLKRANYPGLVSDMVGQYARHQLRLRELLERNLPPDIRVKVPEGGLSLWLSMPPGSDVSEIYYHAVQHGVAFLAGEVFYASRPDPNTLRISFGRNSEDELEDGVNRLCDVIRDLAAPVTAAPLSVI